MYDWWILKWNERKNRNLTLSAFFLKNSLKAHNWQKWKSRFLTCQCHKIYRVEAVGLKRSNYTFKITIFVSMWNLGQFREKLIFSQYLLNEMFESKILLHICDAYNCD